MKFLFFFFFCKGACYLFHLEIVLYLKIFREGKLEDLNWGSYSEEVDANERIDQEVSKIDMV